MLSASDLVFTYRRGAGAAPPHAGDAAVLRGVSLEIQRGTVVGILGPNGSGKTTLLKILAGLLRPASGRVALDGRDLASWSRLELARRLAVVPQETHPAFEYSVLEIVLMGRYPHLGAFELEGPDDLRLARGALQATGTTGLEARPFSTLSGGEKQRVIVAAALAQAADLLLLDEPTASLDLAYQLEVASLLRALNAERGITILLSTHDLNLAASVCTHVVLLREGSVLDAGPTASVITPATVRALYGVDADVRHHDAAGHLTIVPVARRHTEEARR